MKTDTIIGTAITKHQHSIIFRRHFSELNAIRERCFQLLDGVHKYGRFNAQKEIWRLTDKRTIEFGAMDKPEDAKKYQGRPHDFIGFDEICNFTQSQFRFVIGWNRPAKSSDSRQRCRVICAGNPPTDAEGDWVIEFWGPWLDPNHPKPAADGELRWYATIDGKDVECVDGTPIEWFDERAKRTETIQPKSRTFIRGLVTDNPWLMQAGYMATLQAMEEPLRSQMLYGDFTIGQKEDVNQVIPTSWVRLAMARWTPDGHMRMDMDALGVDVARGGKDKTVLTPRHGTWFGRQLVYPGKATPDGMEVANLCRSAIPDGMDPRVQIDVVGVGSSPYDMCKLINLDAVALNGSAATRARDRTKKVGFANDRARWYWQLREALDPNLPKDEWLAIPPDRELLADLTAARRKHSARGIAIESKDEIIARIGRSPDKGDSLVYAHATPRDPPSWATAPLKSPSIPIYQR